jgi:hypothetical protein
MRNAALLLLVGGLGLAAGPVARASDRFAASFQLSYLSTQVAASTGLSTVMTWDDPGAPGGVPKAIQRIELRFDPGTRLDTAALPACAASDLEVRLLGASACPPDSKLGSGSTIGVFSFGLQFTTQVTLFNATNQIIVLVTVDELPVTEFRDDVLGSEIIVNPALPPGVSLKRLAIRIDPHATVAGAIRRSYLRTPATCPESGRWTTDAVFTYDDGSSQSLTSGSACDLTAAQVRQPNGHATQQAIRLSVKPRDVAAGQRIRFRFLATTLSGRVRRAVPATTIRFAGRSTQTNGSGHASIVTSFARAGRHRAIASKPGFIAARTFVAVH